MFDFFKRQTPAEYNKAAEDIYKMVKPTQSESKEYYRVGRTADGNTTLTMLGHDGTSMTLTMNQEACEQMIRMLESTFAVETTEEEHV
jgi:uncharacterized lipoprotein NlpE involved in copper resistance